MELQHTEVTQAAFCDEVGKRKEIKNDELEYNEKTRSRNTDSWLMSIQLLIGDLLLVSLILQQWQVLQGIERYNQWLTPLFHEQPEEVT